MNNAGAATDASKAIEIWGIGTPRTLRAYWALHELDLRYVSRPVRTRTTDMNNPDFLTVSPGHKIPALRQGDLTLVESGAIVAYLYDLAGALAATRAARAEIARWSYFALTELDATALYVLRRHRGLPEVYGTSRIACTAAENYFMRQITQVDNALSDGRSYLVGTTFSAADIHIASCCLWAVREGLTLPAHVDAYIKTLERRDAYLSAVAVNSGTSGAVCFDVD